MKRTTYFAVAICIALPQELLFTSAAANQNVSSNSDVVAIRAAGKEYVNAAQRRDVETLQSMWTPDGDYIDASGAVFKAKELLRRLSESAAESKSDIEIPRWDSTVRLITPVVAIEDGILNDIKQPNGRTLTSRFTAIWVKRDGRWFLDSLREATCDAEAINKPLRELEWLIGEWAGTSEDADILVSTHFSEDGHYIFRSFRVSAEGREAITATERIAWDPAAKKFKSWMFDSQGGTGEGFWVRDGENWRVESTATMPTGETTTSQCIYRPALDGSFTWQAVQGLVGSEVLPTQQVEFKRALDE